MLKCGLNSDLSLVWNAVWAGRGTGHVKPKDTDSDTHTRVDLWLCCILFSSCSLSASFVLPPLKLELPALRLSLHD
jgi:hypothetical protein